MSPNAKAVQAPDVATASRSNEPMVVNPKWTKLTAEPKVAVSKLVEALGTYEHLQHFRIGMDTGWMEVEDIDWYSDETGGLHLLCLMVEESNCTPNEGNGWNSTHRRPLFTVYLGYICAEDWET